MYLKESLDQVSEPRWLTGFQCGSLYDLHWYTIGLMRRVTNPLPHSWIYDSRMISGVYP
jgi:hypothetical protein